MDELLNYLCSDLTFIAEAELPEIKPMTNEIAQREANADFITEQQQLRIGNNEYFSGYRY